MVTGSPFACSSAAVLAPIFPKPITAAGRQARMSPWPRISDSTENTTDWPIRKSSGTFSGLRATENTGHGTLSSPRYRCNPFSVSSITAAIRPLNLAHSPVRAGAK
jgi:hypothetical protein